MGSTKPDTLSDDAQDFLASLRESPRRWQLVERALKEAATEADVYLEVTEAGAALAGAELIAAMRGHAHADLKDEISEWESLGNPRNIPRLTELAIRAVERIGVSSESAELWAETSHLNEWLESLADLKRRLEAPIVARTPRKRLPKVRVKPGDVFQISLFDEAYAYGRITENEAFHIYSKVTKQPNQPPIGTRQFLFYHVGLDGALRDAVFPVVGYDPWDEDEAGRDPRFYSGSFPQLRVCNGKGDCLINNASNADCFGLECFSIYGASNVVDRILEGESGPTARSGWPVVPDENGKLRAMPWTEWRIENDKLHAHSAMEYLKAIGAAGRERSRFWEEFQAQRDRKQELLRLGITE